MPEHPADPRGACSPGSGNLEQLRRAWQPGWGPLPKCRSVDLLELMVAWKQQAREGGGLDPETRRMLRRPPGSGAGRVALTGARIVREWQGEEHVVTALGQDGYLYRGETFRSLSEVARKVTGTRWNGPRFFGLRDAREAAR